jgi:DNA-binding NarL/FixJ family response regulator
MQSSPLTILLADDHPLILSGTIALIEQAYPQAQVIIAQTAQETLSLVEKSSPHGVILDLSLPETASETAELNTGIRLLQDLMQRYSSLNIMVQSSFPKALIRLKSYIDNHEGGFTIASKSIPPVEMLKMLDWSLQGVTHTKILKTSLEVKPEWLEVLHLAFQEGLQDKAIAARMYKSLRMIRNYWAKIQDVLAVYPEDDQNLKALTLIRAKEEGLID